MTDALFQSFEETGEIVSELQHKAVEAARRGESRRTFFRNSASLAGSTVLGAAGIELLKPVTAFAAGQPACTTKYTDVLSIAATAEFLAVTFYYTALQSQATLPTVNNTANRNYFQAAVTQEYIHEETLVSLGGAPLATQFYFPETMFTKERQFFKTSQLLETFFISAYIAAAREFSGMISSEIKVAKPKAIGLAVQIAGVECEHRALLRVAANENPPNDLPFERDVVACVEDAVTALTPFLQGGTGFSTTPIPVPTKSEVDSIASPYGFSFFPTVKIV